MTTARTFNDQRGDVDAALMAAIGFAGPATDSFERGGPYLARGAADLVPTSRLLDDYRGMIFCTIRNYHDVQPSFAAMGDNGYSQASAGTIFGFGLPNPYVYPDNLPRTNAKGDRRRPGCWQKITRELWPQPVSGDGHRIFTRALQPYGARPAALRRLRLGAPSRRAHHQPVTLT